MSASNDDILKTRRKQLEAEIDGVNAQIIIRDIYPEIENVGERLKGLKDQFLKFDINGSGEIDVIEMKVMMEKTGQAKTHIEVKNLMSELAKTKSGCLTYREFLEMSLGPRPHVPSVRSLFQNQKKGEKPKHRAPIRTLESLP